MWPLYAVVPAAAAVAVAPAPAAAAAAVGVEAEADEELEDRDVALDTLGGHSERCLLQHRSSDLCSNRTTSCQQLLMLRPHDTIMRAVHGRSRARLEVQRRPGLL